MDSAEIGVLIGGVALVIFVIWFFFGEVLGTSTPATDEDKPYACPMHPWIVSDDPAANCSICGMKLTKRDTMKKE